MTGDQPAVAIPELDSRFGALMKARRRQRRLTITELARKTGFSLSYLANIEAGRGNPTLTTLLAIDAELRLGLAELLTPQVPPEMLP